MWTIDHKRIRGIIGHTVQKLVILGKALRNNAFLLTKVKCPVSGHFVAHIIISL